MRKDRQRPPSNPLKKSSLAVLIAKYGLIGTVTAALIGVIGVGFTAYFGYLGIRTQIEEPIKATQTAEAAQAQIEVPINATLTQTPTAAPTNTPLPCPYQGSDDLTTFTNLINAEADAVNKTDFQIIQEIFSPNAVIHDFNPEKVWDSPTARYQNDLFKNTKIKGALHFDIRIDARSNSTQAWATSGSRGFYLGEGGVWKPYENPSAANPTVVSGSDHWTFGRNNAGCWVIVQYEFDASHMPFP